MTDLSSAEETGTYEGDIEIISTGIPAKLYYDSSSIKSFEIESDLSNVTKGKWAGNSAQRTAYLDSANGGFNYTNRSTSNKNIYAASGLLYNFENIVFSISAETSSKLNTGSGNAFESDDTRNYGGYIEVKNNGTAITASSTTTVNDLFEANIASGSVAGMRSVTLKDIKGTNDDSNTTTITTSVDINGADNADKRKGLFRLDQYNPDKHSSGRYWLASPTSTYSANRELRCVTAEGGFGDYYSQTNGLRPIISISNVKLQLKGNVWKIVK